MSKTKGDKFLVVLRFMCRPQFYLSISCVAGILIVLSLSSSLAAQEINPSTAKPTVTAPTLSDYDKEALTTIKEMTSNLLFLAIGVFALVGGYLSKDAPGFAGRRTLLTSFSFFGISLLAGLIVFMALIAQLQSQRFDPNAGWVRCGATVQIVSLMVGAVLFFFFLVANIKGPRP